MTWPSRSKPAVARAIAAFAAGACSRRTAYGPRPDRGRQRASVHPPHAPGLGELLQIAADGVERDIEGGAELGDDDLAVAVELLEDHLAPFFGQHHAN